MRARQLIHDRWRLRHGDLDPAAPLGIVDVEARVPGAVHLDLLAAGLIDDPYLDRNEDAQHWVGRSAWVYERTLSSSDLRRQLDEGDRIDLVFDGLDTFATVRIDDTVLGSVENQHRRYRFDVTDYFRDGARLSVEFGPPTLIAAQRRDVTGDLPNPYGEPYNFVRKMACNFGWDWGPTLTTSGIWRDVALEVWNTARVAAVRAHPHVDGVGTGIATVDVDLEFDSVDDPAEVEVEVAIGEIVARAAPRRGESSVQLRLPVPNVIRWWPRGYGEPHLYDLDVRIVSTSDGGARTHDAHASRIGFRTVVLDTSPAEDGTRWAIEVNGRRIWVRGVNWIPDDCFPARVDDARYDQRLAAAVDANVNLLRIWGGGIYESDHFYDRCDELGLLVWQDFLFACAAYDEEFLRDEVRHEVIDNVNRLMSHPSLALWNANNENLWGWWSWGWPDDVGDRTWGEGFYRDLLPSLVAELDPTRPFIDGSPTSGDPSIHPNDQDHGPMHIWTVWNDIDYLHYRDFSPRFVAEFGYQAPPTHATLTRAITSRPLAVDNADLVHHQKAFDGHRKLKRGLDDHFGEVHDFDSWLFLTQLNQARAIDVGIGHFRRLHDRCAGAVLWQLNDCWPVVSWAVVDGDGRPKPSWYALRRVFADRLVVVEPDGDGVAVALVNDTDTPWDSPVTVRVVDPDGATTASLVLDTYVAAHGATKRLLPTPAGHRPDAAPAVIIADVDDHRAVFSWTLDRAFPYRARAIDTRVIRGDRTTRIEVTAQTLIRDLCLFPDRLDPDARADTALVTLAAGERHTFVVDRPLDADDATLTSAPVLTCVNDQLRGSAPS